MFFALRCAIRNTNDDVAQVYIGLVDSFPHHVESEINNKMLNECVHVQHSYLWFPLPSCLQTSHSNFLPVLFTILSQFCLTCSAACTIHLSARACSWVPTIRYPISSERYLATPRIRDSDIWGSFVTGLVLYVVITSFL